MGRTGQDPPPEGLYVFGVLPADDGIELGDCPRFDGERVEGVRAASLYALVARVRAEDLLGTSALPGLDPERLTTLVGEHDTVLRAITASGRAVVPLPFGTVVGDLDDLRRRVERRCVALYDALARLEGCDEWGVHVSVPREAAQRAVRSLARQVYERLAAGADDAVIEPIASRAREERPSALSAAFLVNRDRVQGFHRTIDELQGYWDMADCAIRVSGPWPCYHFARVDLGPAPCSPEASVLLGPLSAPERAWVT